MRRCRGLAALRLTATSRVGRNRGTFAAPGGTLDVITAVARRTTIAPLARDQVGFVPINHRCNSATGSGLWTQHQIIAREPSSVPLTSPHFLPVRQASANAG